MSYANVAASGPSQSAEEARAPPVPEIVPSTDTSDKSVSLIDVDTPHVSSVPSDFEAQEVQTSTQADRLEREADAAVARARAIEHAAAEHARAAAAKARAEAGEAKRFAKENKDNPVLLSNAGVLVLVAGLLGVGAYRKHVKGELGWKVVGAWTGVVGLFALGDYYVSRYFFKKYPTK